MVYRDNIGAELACASRPPGDGPAPYLRSKHVAARWIAQRGNELAVGHAPLHARDVVRLPGAP